MNWTYVITTGFLYTPDGVKLTPPGYSGAGADMNQPAEESVQNQGPIPEGWYTRGEPQEGTEHGPYAIPLTPDPENQEYGRGGFWMHGDSIKNPGCASKGCIIQGHDNRVQFGSSAVTRLQVVSVLPMDVVSDPEIGM